MRIFLKILFTTIFAIATFTMANGQSIIVYGYVKSISNNSGIANHQVIIDSQIDTATSTGMTYYSTVFTANNGFFLDSVTIPYGQNIKFRISTLDCQNLLVIDTFFSAIQQPANLLICDSGLISCKADYLTYPDTANHRKVHFINMSIPANAHSLWYFGDGDSSTLKNPIHIYATNGNYVVTLSIWDTVTPCFSQRIDTIKVSPVLYCNNTFSYTTNLLTASFSGSVNNNLPTVYKWNFGDLTTVTGQNPIHIYVNPGIYKVILQSISVNPQNFDTCISTSFKFITIQGPSIGSIWGQVFADTGKVRDAEVILYYFQNQQDGYLATDTVDITVIDSLNLSYYYFSNIPFGKYITKAQLKTGSNIYNQFSPTYIGNTFNWNEAKAFNHNHNISNNHIHLTPISQSNGIVHLEGKVIEGTQKNPGEPIPGVLLFIYDVQGDIIGYTYSDQNGFYSFDQLEFKKYYIHADIINKNMNSVWVWPVESTPVLNDINIYVGKDEITSLGSFEAINASVFPNPVEDEINIILNATTLSEFNFELYNSMGQLVMQYTADLMPDKNIIKLDVNHLPKGLYTLKIGTSNQSPTSIKIVLI